jgi:hypothetical protein
MFGKSFKRLVTGPAAAAAVGGSTANAGEATEKSWTLAASSTLNIAGLCAKQVTIRAENSANNISVQAKAERSEEIDALTVEGNSISMDSQSCNDGVVVNGSNVIFGSNISIINNTVYVNGVRQDGNGSTTAKKRTLMVDVIVPSNIGLDLKAQGATPYTIEGDYSTLRLAVEGSGKIDMRGSGKKTVLRIAGSGDVSLGHIGTGNITVAGSGNADIASLRGDATVVVQGSGNVTIDEGDIPSLNVSVRGSGDVKIGANVDEAFLDVMGSGDIKVSTTPKNVSKSVMGSGRIKVGGR